MYFNFLNNPKLIINETKFPKEFVYKMLDNFISRTVLNHTEMEMLVKILIVAKEGVDDLKHVLDILNISLDHPPEYKINIVPMSSPIYKLYVSGPEDKICREIINSLAKKVKNRVKGKGTFKIHHEPYVLRQTVQSFKFIPSQELSTLIL
jgi:translation initiation factor 2 alpha subunit (eIF-2alpha)